MTDVSTGSYISRACKRCHMHSCAGLYLVRPDWGKPRQQPCDVAIFCLLPSLTACILTLLDRTPHENLTCPVERQEVVVWKSLDACGHQVAAQAQLDWDGGGKELLLECGVQTAHVAQPVWLKVQHLLRFCWCIHLQQAPFAPPTQPGTQDCLLSTLAK